MRVKFAFSFFFGFKRWFLEATCDWDYIIRKLGGVIRNGVLTHLITNTWLEDNTHSFGLTKGRHHYFWGLVFVIWFLWPFLIPIPLRFSTCTCLYSKTCPWISTPLFFNHQTYIYIYIYIKLNLVTLWCMRGKRISQNRDMKVPNMSFSVVLSLLKLIAPEISH